MSDVSSISLRDLFPIEERELPTGRSYNCIQTLLMRLDAIKIIIQNALKAISSFEEGFFERFDASVGDQACQIRALQFCLLHPILDSSRELFVPKLPIIERLRESITQLDPEIAKLKEELDPFLSRKREIGLEKSRALGSINSFRETDSERYFRERKLINKSFSRRFKKVDDEMLETRISIERLQEKHISENFLDIQEIMRVSIPEDVLFLLDNYLVKKVRKVILKKRFGICDYKEVVDMTQLLPRGKHGLRSLMRKVIDMAKKRIRRSSIFFVQTQAQFLTDPRLSLLVSLPRRIESKGHLELPFFYLTRVIFQRAAQKNISILLKVRNKNDNPLVEESFVCRHLFGSSDEILDLSSRCIVIESFSSRSSFELRSEGFIEDLLTFAGGSFLHMIDLSAAQHNQFTDMRTSLGFDEISGILAEEKHELLLLARDARVKGFSLANSSTCCIEHVFCDLISHQTVNSRSEGY
ncbi:MAG: hypothetical protein ACFFG0_20895 [Candidatus Thorarchaeota archaeon]